VAGVFRDSDASALSGIWLHRQPADDLSSTDDCAFSEEDDSEAAADNVLHAESGCQLLDTADIAAFDTLLSGSTDVDPSAHSNVELLSMLTVDDDVTVGSTSDPPRCDGVGCGSVTEAEHEVWTNDETDGVSAADMNETLVADSSTVVSYPRTGSVIESGSGDLTQSPVHHTDSGASSILTASVQSAYPSVVSSKPLSQSWQRDAASSSLSSNEETRYVVEAAELISVAQEHEIAENYPAAYSHYRSGIEILVKGVQSRHFYVVSLFLLFVLFAVFLVDLGWAPLVFLVLFQKRNFGIQHAGFGGWISLV